MSALHEAIKVFRALDEGLKAAQFVAKHTKPGLWSKIKGAAGAAHHAVKHAAGAAAHAIKQDWARSGYHGGKAIAAKTPHAAKTPFKPHVDLKHGAAQQKVADEKAKITNKLRQKGGLRKAAKSGYKGGQSATDAKPVSGAAGKLKAHKAATAGFKPSKGRESSFKPKSQPVGGHGSGSAAQVRTTRQKLTPSKGRTTVHKHGSVGVGAVSQNTSRLRHLRRNQAKPAPQAAKPAPHTPPAAKPAHSAATPSFGRRPLRSLTGGKPAGQKQKAG